MQPLFHLEHDVWSVAGLAHRRLRQHWASTLPHWRTLFQTVLTLGRLGWAAALEAAFWGGTLGRMVWQAGVRRLDTPVAQAALAWWQYNQAHVGAAALGLLVVLALAVLAGAAQTGQAMHWENLPALASEGQHAEIVARFVPMPTPTLRPMLALVEPTANWAAPPPTPEPTATPFGLDYREWASTLPAEGGWDGAGACPGAVWSPVGAQAWHWPTEMRFLSGRNYGYYHPGLDFAADYGSPIYASDMGVVVYAGWNYYGYGNLLIVDHGNGWHTLYAHLDQLGVACGQVVSAGQVIGLAGSTGNSTGPHLHFELRGPTGRVNPWHYLP